MATQRRETTCTPPPSALSARAVPGGSVAPAAISGTVGIGEGCRQTQPNMSSRMGGWAGIYPGLPPPSAA